MPESQVTGELPLPLRGCISTGYTSILGRVLQSVTTEGLQGIEMQIGQNRVVGERRRNREMT